jgi:sulfoxide reductase heme-binding subunit YedZ
MKLHEVGTAVLVYPAWTFARRHFPAKEPGFCWAVNERSMSLKVNSWSLFLFLAVAVSISTLLGLSHTDFNSARGMRSIVHRSVRCALPLFVLAFTTSSLSILWPSTLTRWMLANRRYIGLAFAFAMVWHFAFVGYTIWSFGNPLNVKATLMDVVGFIFLLLLTLTSFRWGASYLSRANWRRLHKTGVYAIWLVATLIYLHAVRVDAGLTYRAFLGVLLVAWMLRVAAWARLRLSRQQRNRREPATLRSARVE